MTLRQDWEDSRHGEDLELLNARQRQRQQEIAARRLRPYLENADLAPNAQQVVDVPRHTYHHYGRWVTAEQRVYVLHSQECLDCGRDLRDCRFSVALDQGADPLAWLGLRDVPVLLGIVDGRLFPLKELGTPCGPSWWATCLVEVTDDEALG